MRIAVRTTGWLLIVAGTTVALYLVYALYWTGRATAQTQDALLESFQLQVDDLDRPADSTAESGGLDPHETVEEDTTSAGLAPLADVDVGEAIATLEFVRPRDDGPVVLDGPVVVVEGVTTEALASGPGRYPASDHPGQWGNFAVAGHRTTYGAPFHDLDQLQDGDEIHVTDSDGTRWVYAFAGMRIVAPAETGVLADDPLSRGRPMLTLTTCHPRWSSASRLIVFAELVEEQVARARPA